jgi:hypothetical protein
MAVGQSTPTGTDQSASSPAGPVTRLQCGIVKPKKYTDGTVKWGMTATASQEELASVHDALKDQNWVAAMDAEHQALIKNRT